MTDREGWINMVAQSALSEHHILRSTYDLARLAIERGIPGDFVECGVYAGANSAMLAQAIEDTGARERRVHLFDSFEGIPAPTEHDEAWIAAGHPVGTSACDLESTRSNMVRIGIDERLLVYHQGWFDHTVPLAASDEAVPHLRLKQIAILRLDGDLYASTKVCLEHLYPLLSPGGWLIVDDFALDGCRKAYVDYFGKGGPFPAYFQKGRA